MAHRPHQYKNELQFFYYYILLLLYYITVADIATSSGSRNIILNIKCCIKSHTTEPMTDTSGLPLAGCEIGQTLALISQQHLTFLHSCYTVLPWTGPALSACCVVTKLITKVMTPKICSWVVGTTVSAETPRPL